MKTYQMTMALVLSSISCSDNCVKFLAAIFSDSL